MSDTPEVLSVTTGKRKAEPSYEDLKNEVKELKAKLRECRDQYNSVVPKYNKLWRQVEKAKQDYSELADKHQGLKLDNNTLRSIAFFSD